jgi:hypothetical protein
MNGLPRSRAARTTFRHARHRAFTALIAGRRGRVPQLPATLPTSMS